MHTDTLDALAETIIQTLGLDPATELTSATPLFGVMPELDSLSLIELITQLEDRFHFVMDEQDITFEVFETIGSLTDYLEQHRN